MIDATGAARRCWELRDQRQRRWCVEICGAKLANWLRVQGQIRLLVRQRKLTSCSRGKPPRLFTVTSPNEKQELHASHWRWLAWPVVLGVGWYRSGKALLTAGTVLTGFHGDGRDESSCQMPVYCQIRLLVRQRKLTSCSRGKPCLFTVTSHTK